MSVWIHKACGTEIESELFYSDSAVDYYFPVCPKCQTGVEMEDIELIHNKWALRFLRVAMEIASWSKDPRHKVGCVIVDDDRNQLSGGYNGFPRRVADDHRLEDSTHTVAESEKLLIMIHAEANAVAAAARNGHSIKGSIVYITRPP